MSLSWQKLIDSGADIDAIKHEDGFNLLHVASDANRTEAVQLLITKGANLSVKTKKGLTALDLARKKRYFKIGALLAVALNEKLDIDIHWQTEADPRELKEAMDEEVLLCSLPRAFESDPHLTFKRVYHLVEKSNAAESHFRAIDSDAAEKIKEGTLSIQHCLIPMLRKDMPAYLLAKTLLPWSKEDENGLSLLEGAVRSHCTALVASNLLQQLLDARWSIVVRCSLPRETAWPHLCSVPLSSTNGCMIRVS